MMISASKAKFSKVALGQSKAFALNVENQTTKPFSVNAATSILFVSAAVKIGKSKIYSRGFRNEISERLKQLRTLHGLKLREVSKKTGLSLSYISDLERGRQNPSLETCQKLATVYKITLSEIFVEVKL